MFDMIRMIRRIRRTLISPEMLAITKLVIMLLTITNASQKGIGVLPR